MSRARQQSTSQRGEQQARQQDARGSSYRAGRQDMGRARQQSTSQTGEQQTRRQDARGISYRAGKQIRTQQDSRL